MLTSSPLSDHIKLFFHPIHHILLQMKTNIKKQNKCSQAFCCTCRLSVSSSEEAESSSSSARFPTVSSIAHAMVQEKLDRMIRDREEQRSRRARDEEMKFVLMVAMEKASYDPRQDFRESMEQMIVANKIREIKDLRRLLNYYVSMNSEDFRGTILEVFHEVCTDLFVYL